MKNESSDAPRLRIETATLLRLGPFWNGLTLSGHFWRLYWHDSPGAAVRWNGRRIELLPDRLYLLPPYCNLEAVCTGTPVQMFCHFELTGVGGSAACRCSELPLSPVLRPLLDRLLAELEAAPGPRRTMAAAALTAAALLELPDDAVNASGFDYEINRLCEKIRTDPQLDWSREKMARLLGVPEHELVRRFRAFSGGPPNRYLQQLRYSRAARLLAATSRSIEEICAEIGVRDRFHFSRRFRDFYGEPPAAYRRRLRREGETES